MAHLNDFLLRAAKDEGFANHLAQVLRECIESAVAFKNGTRGEIGYTVMLTVRSNRLSDALRRVESSTDILRWRWTNPERRNLARKCSDLDLALEDVRSVLPYFVLQKTEVRRRITRLKQVAREFEERYLS